MRIEELLSQYPKPLMVGVILLAGGIFVFLSNPPHTPCDSQAETFRKQHAEILKLRPRGDGPAQSRLQSLQEACREANSPGGCEPYFRELRRVSRSLSVVPEECMPDISQTVEVANIASQALTLFVRIGWGHAVPASRSERMGWLEPVDLVLFCEMRSLFQQARGSAGLRGLVESLRPLLPEAGAMTAGELWSRTLLSLDCSGFQGG